MSQNAAFSQTSAFEGQSCCIERQYDYTITYKIGGTSSSNINNIIINNNGNGNLVTRTNKICKKCISSECVFDNKFGKMYFLQLNILKITCAHCGLDVTKTRGCRQCDTVFETADDDGSLPESSIGGGNQRP